MVTHSLFQKHLDVSALYRDRNLYLEGLVKPREAPDECMEPAQFQDYLGANKPSLNMEGFDIKGRDRVFLH